MNANILYVIPFGAGIDSSALFNFTTAPSDSNVPQSRASWTTVFDNSFITISLLYIITIACIPDAALESITLAKEINNEISIAARLNFFTKTHKILICIILIFTESNIIQYSIRRKHESFFTCN